MTPLIDAHQHLMYPEFLGYDWAAGVPALAGRDFSLEDYQDLTMGSGVAGTIFMEVDVDATDIAAEAELIAARRREPGSSILGLIAACRPETEEGFERWLERAEELGIVGYRRVLHIMPDGLSQDLTFRANVRRIGLADRTFDMCFLARQLPLARDFAKACGDTVLVLDHCGVPDIAGGGLDPWRADLTALAELPNVHVKLSGVFAYCAPGTATLSTVRPWLEHVVAAFGPDRCLWGSDWPVVNLRADLPAWIAAFREFLGQFSETEAAEMAHGTAARVYGVKLSV